MATNLYLSDQPTLLLGSLWNQTFAARDGRVTA